MMPWLALLPVLYVVAVAQTSLVDLVEIGRVGPNLFALGAVAWAMLVPGAGAVVGAALFGLAEDLVAPGPLGPAMACYLAVGYCLGALPCFPISRQIVPRVAIVAGAVTLATLVLVLVAKLLGEVSLPWSTLLVRAGGVGAYTAAVSLPLWMVVGWCRPLPPEART